ncbi:MAG: glycosyltransferase family 2 protein [Dehalococcoidia bacterium]|nr:glycosyltransferase family 2 protein [Dehalococcoidia bacterium]
MRQSANPKVSMVITTCNRADLLPRAINSVLAQTYTDYEIIIVDDCSQDKTREVILGFSDPRIRVIRHEINRGSAAARNTGIDHALGEHITFLDDDDECTPNRLADQVRVLDINPNVGVVYGWVEEMNDATGTKRTPRNIQNTHRGRAAFEAALTGISDTASMAYPCIRASVVRQVGGYDERLAAIGEDAVFMASVTRICDAEYVPAIIARVHVNHAYDRLSQTASPSAFDKFLEVHMQKFGDELRRRPKTLANFHAASAAGLMRVRQPRRAMGYILRAFRTDPFSPDNFSRLIYFGKAFIWHATPLRRFRTQARNIRSVILGSGKRQIS